MGELAEPFERMSPADASEMLASTYGLRPSSLVRLDTERDDSYRVTTPTGDFVLKVAHPDDDPMHVNLQTAALAFAAEMEPQLPLQSLVLSAEGDVEPTIVHAGRERIARVLTWLVGTPLGETRPELQQLELLGASLGRLTNALSTFDHPAAHRDMAWDVARLPLVRDLLDEYPMAETRAAFDLFDRVVAPRRAALPQQVIHNDFHLGNVLVDAANPAYVTGIIDFGDTVHTARVADLAVAVSYLVVPGEASAEEVAHFTSGYETQVRLTDDERVVLPALVIGRVAQRILVNLRLARGNPDDRGAAESAAETNRAALAALLEKEG